jgi:hypothetical protein
MQEIYSLQILLTEGMRENHLVQIFGRLMARKGVNLPAQGRLAPGRPNK